jgi:hypothetical protein
LDFHYKAFFKELQACVWSLFCSSCYGKATAGSWHPGKVLPKAAVQPSEFGGTFTCNQRWGVKEISSLAFVVLEDQFDS